MIFWCRTVELFENYPDVLEEYQRRFRYILVDEYQDTNTAQFKIVWSAGEAAQKPVRGR